MFVKWVYKPSLRSGITEYLFIFTSLIVYLLNGGSLCWECRDIQAPSTAFNNVCPDIMYDKKVSDSYCSYISFLMQRWWCFFTASFILLHAAMISPFWHIFYLGRLANSDNHCRYLLLLNFTTVSVTDSMQSSLINWPRIFLKTTTTIKSAFSLLQSCPLLEPHTLSSLVSIVESIAGTPSLW